MVGVEVRADFLAALRIFALAPCDGPFDNWSAGIEFGTPWATRYTFSEDHLVRVLGGHFEIPYVSERTTKV